MNQENHPLLNPNNWLNKTTKEAEAYKISCMLSFDLTYNHKEIDESKFESLNTIVYDVDILAYLFSKYIIQKDYCLDIPNIKKHLNNEEDAKHILKFGCVSLIANKILNNHPKMKDDLDVFMMIKHKDQYVINQFSELLKKDNNLEKVLNLGYISEDLLRVYPKNLKISQMLIKNGRFPSDAIRKFFNDEAFDNKNDVIKIFGMLNGYMYYSKLPEKLQFDPEICKAVLLNHPHTLVKVYDIKNFEDWTKLLSNNKDPFRYELYALLDSAEKYKTILQNDDDILQFYKLIADKKSTCYVDLMGGPIFSDHPIQPFTKKLAKKSKVVKEFIKSEFGKKFIEYPISNYSEFSKFESEEIPQVYSALNKCFLKLNLESYLPTSGEKTKKSKI